MINNNGAAFNGNGLMSYHPNSQLIKDSDGNPLKCTKYISLSKFCRLNFVTKRVARNAIAKKLLVAVRYKGQWWVAIDPKCLDDLKDYLGVDAVVDCQRPSTS
jgi:hypothetical protein